MAYGTVKALAADLMPAELRGAAYGTITQFLASSIFRHPWPRASCSKELGNGRGKPIRTFPFWRGTCRFGSYSAGNLETETTDKHRMKKRMNAEKRLQKLSIDASSKTG
jgi:hypothetical protein